MNRIFSISALAAAAAIALAGTAIAADMPVKAPPPPPIPTWTGTYIGINGGYGWGTTRQTDEVFTNLTTGDFNQTGGLAGITWGGNWQAGHIVLGFEGDLDWADIKGSFTSAALCGVAGGNTCFTNVKALSTERFRLGYDVDGWLLFATGGAAFGDVNAGQNPCTVGAAVGGGSSCGERWRAGWVAGVGLEKMIFPKFSAKIEYLHYDLGNDVFQYRPVTPVGANQQVDTLRIGLNYFFDFTHLLP
jgi:outer membrane immunogenic protein